MMSNRIAFVWENFGPSHHDRIEAVANAGFEVTGIQFNRASQVYRWEAVSEGKAQVHALSAQAQSPGALVMTWRLVRALIASRAQHVFLCHYQYAPVFYAAVILRLMGRQVFTMIDSKFDDYPRRIGRELLKLLMLWPYSGVLTASRRSREYLHFLGFVRRPIELGFDSLNLERLRSAAAGARDLPHAQRDFLIVARLVAKKNLSFALRAFAAHQASAIHARNLRLVGYGEEEANLRSLAAELGIADRVVFAGGLDSTGVAIAMREALCLILPSVEEQFGLVAIEAMTQGLPVIISTHAGAVDELIDNGVNGVLVDPYRPAGLIAAMSAFDSDEALWKRTSAAARLSSERGGADLFVAGVQRLVQSGEAVSRHSEFS